MVKAVSIQNNASYPVTQPSLCSRAYGWVKNSLTSADEKIAQIWKATKFCLKQLPLILAFSAGFAFAGSGAGGAAICITLLLLWKSINDPRYP